MAKQSFDVVIVGAGTAGLNTGSLLATAGKKVLVLDKQSKPGGRAVSTRYKNCVLENGIHGLIKTGHLEEVFNKIGKTLPQNLIKWVNGRIFLDGKWVKLEDILINSLEELMAVFNDAVFERSYEQLHEIMDVSVEKYAYGVTKDEGVLTWLLFMGWLYGGTRFPPSDMSAGSLFWTFKKGAEANENNEFLNLGYLVQGGSGALAAPLVEAIEENGGEVRMNTTVSKVIIKDGRAQGVEVESQERLIPTQVVDTEIIEASSIIVAVPLWEILNVVSEDDLPSWYAERVQFLSKRTLNTWTLTYMLDKKPSFDETEMMCVPKGTKFGRPWIAGMLPFSEKEGQYSVTCFFYTAWHEPPCIFETAKASVKAQIRQLFDDFEDDIRDFFPELEANCLWKVRSVGPSAVHEAPGNVGKHLLSMIPEGVEDLYLVGEKTQEAEIMGIYGSAQVALKCADQILKK